MYSVDVVMKKVEDWVAQKEIEMDLEDDKQEARLIWERVHNVKQNLQYYIKGQLDKAAYFHFCKDCGVIEFCNYVQDTKNRMIENKTCFICDFWQVRDQEYLNGNKRNTIIINGSTYSDGGATKGRNTNYNGFGGAIFKIRMLDGSKEWETNNLWYGGVIPKKYKTTTMKDTAEFIK